MSASTRGNPFETVTRYVRTYHLAPRYAEGKPLSLRAADGVRLAAVQLDGPPDASVNIVLAHGFSNWSRSPRIHAFATHLSNRAHVVVPDLRGHGRSEGVTTFGEKEPLDVEAAADALREAHPGLPVVTV